MRQAAFSPHDQCKIVRVLRRQGKWEGTRASKTINMARIKTATGLAILYSVELKRNCIVSDRSATVADAILAINQLLNLQPQRTRNAPFLTTPTIAWLPYKDAAEV